MSKFLFFQPVPKQLIGFYSLSLFNHLKRINSQNVTTQTDDFERPLWLKHRNYALKNGFICLKCISTNFSTKLHSQFNYHTLPQNPFIIKSI